MAEKKASRVIDSWKQKKWYKIVSPEFMGARIIGETVAPDENSLIGRTVKISLSAVTGDVKKQNILAVFEIKEVKNNEAQTYLKRMEISPSSVRRMIRKGKNRIDLSILCGTKDNMVVRIKPFLVTRAQIGNSLLRKMRNMLDAVLRNEISNVVYDNLMIDILTGKLQKRVRQVVGKLYPLKSSEIRVVEKAATDKPLLPVPKLPEIKEEKIEETEEEKIEKKVKAKKEEEIPEEKKVKKAKAKKEEAAA